MTDPSNPQPASAAAAGVPSTPESIADNLPDNDDVRDEASHTGPGPCRTISRLIALLAVQTASSAAAILVFSRAARIDSGAAQDSLVRVAALAAAALGICAVVATATLAAPSRSAVLAPRKKRSLAADDSAQRAIAESEQRFRHLFEHASEGIFQSTIEGGYLRVNPALARMYGFDTPQTMMAELTDISKSLYVNPGRRADFVALMLSEGQADDFESEVYRKDGTTIWISESARCVRDADGRVLYFEGFVDNVSARRQIEQDREAMLAEAIARADRDPLTGLLNHRAFHNRLEDEIKRAIDSGDSVAIAVLDMDNFKFFNDAYGHAAGDAVLNQVASHLLAVCRAGDVAARFGGDEFAVMIPDTNAARLREFSLSIRNALKTAGFRPDGYDATIPLGVSLGVATFPTEADTRHNLLDLADERLRRAKLGSDEESLAERLRTGYIGAMSGFKTLDALVTAVDTKDRYTRRHSEDVVMYSAMIARDLGFDNAFIDDLQLTALLHDVGKIGVPDRILRKPGRLDDEEFEMIQQHAIMGAMIVSSVPGFACTLDGIRHHHERWDGAGYPGMLAGEQIPVVARILAVADAFSAMTTNRPYRASMPVDQALGILRRGSGTQWEPRSVEAFLRAYDRAYAGMMAA